VTWDEFEQSLNSTYAGGHHDDGMLTAYRHGIGTVINVLKAKWPAGPDTLDAAEQMESALRYMAQSENWDDETGLLKRPGGGRQEGIVLYSRNIIPHVFAAQFLPAKQRDMLT
jgi:hypothetical protein